jgi:hypothetical protein
MVCVEVSFIILLRRCGRAEHLYWTALKTQLTHILFTQVGRIFSSYPLSRIFTIPIQAQIKRNILRGLFTIDYEYELLCRRSLQFIHFRFRESVLLFFKLANLLVIFFPS